jgi:branched-chain amino acid transport system permease protein
MSARSAWPYLALVIACVAVYLLLPDQLALAARIATMAIFVMSLDLVVGYGGLATLGHAVFFGVGAYATGIAATHLTGNALLGLVIGAGSGAGLAALAGAFLVRYHGLTFLMLTIAIAEIVLNLAKKLRTWTGADDGLSGYSVGKILGLFGFDLQGKVAFIYCCTLLLMSFWAMRRLMRSPFGLACVGIHQNRVRMAAMGDAVQPTLLKLYVCAGFFAGLAGALSAQVNQIVGLDSLGFTLSAESLVMLVLGGTGTLYGAIAGTAIFMSVHHAAASINPYHWLFIIGGMLCVLVLVPRERWAAAVRKRFRRRVPGAAVAHEAPS